MSHYDLLGVPVDATDVVIKRNFRRLSLDLHPDRSPSMEGKYKLVVEAYSILSDPDKRRLYDIGLKEDALSRSLTAEPRWRRGRGERGIRDTGGWRGRGGDSDDDNVGESEDYARREPRRRDESVRSGDAVSPNRIDDIHHTLSVSLEDSFTGVSVPINIIRTVNGKQEEAKLYVDVPPGTDNGEIIILEGKGHIDADLRMRSHVRVRVAVERSDVVRRDGLNIVYSLEITLKEALCGFKKEITHLDGKTYLVASEQGKVIGQGGRRVIPHKGFQRGHSLGNLVIVFHIVMPKMLTMEQIDALSKIL